MRDPWVGLQPGIDGVRDSAFTFVCVSLMYFVPSGHVQILVRSRLNVIESY